MASGLILACLGGVYTVESGGQLFECKARGVFRKKELSPVAGDRCEFEDGVISSVEERKNSIIRPPLANLDVMFFVVSTREPFPNLLILDKFIAVCVYKGITPVVVLTKNDLEQNTEIPLIYGKTGIRVFVCDYGNDDFSAPIKEMIRGRICAFTGNTGVGKSTLLNRLSPSLELETSHISKKLGRGRHTTRVSRLYPLFGGYVADTPGFSTFETEQYAVISPEELPACFEEFSPFTDKCRFRDCTHTKEKGCAVIAAAEEGIIPRSRHESYKVMFEEAREIKPWDLKNRPNV